MEELLKVIYNKLIEITSSTYFKTAPDNTSFPYLVYNLTTSTEIDGCEQGNRQDYIMEIDVWDNLSDVSRLEALTDSITTVLNRAKVKNNYVAVNFYLINRLSLDDPDNIVKRRQLRYRLAVWTINN